MKKHLYFVTRVAIGGLLIAVVWLVGTADSQMPRPPKTPEGQPLMVQPRGQVPPPGQVQPQVTIQPQITIRARDQSGAARGQMSLLLPDPIPADPCVVTKQYMNQYEAVARNAYDSHEYQANEVRLKHLWGKPLSQLPYKYRWDLEKWETSVAICIRFHRECENMRSIRFNIVGLCDY